MQAEDRCNILIVDDRLENLVALESVLEELGQNLVRATSGKEALRRLLDEDFAVILLDVQMPEMDGFETASLIRARERSRHTPIVFLTAINKSDYHVARGYSVGAFDYIFKPFDPEVLKAKVAAFVELSRKTQALEREIEQRKRAEARRDASNALLETISRTLVSFLGDQEPVPAFHDLLQNVLALTGSGYGFIGEFLLDGDGADAPPCLRVFSAAAEGDRRGRRKPGPPAMTLHPSAPFWQRLHEGPILANGAGEVPGKTILPTGVPRLHSFLALPFSSDSSPTGVIALGNRPEGYDPELVAYLQPLVHTCASLAEAYRSHRSRREAEEALRHLNEDLERRVAARTAELETTNRDLELEIQERRRAEEERTRLLVLEQGARAAAEAAQARLAFLGEASALLATSLDYEATLDRLGQLLVPYLADFCLIDVVAEDGGIQRLSTRHVDAAREALMAELRAGYAPHWESPQPAARGLRSGRAELTPQVDEKWLRAAARDERHFQLLKALAPQSYLVVPLVARGHILGVISLGISGGDRRYGPEDLELAEDLARRAAAAIDNARLFREVQNAARRKDEFLAMLAHELRNPLAAISYADYALDRFGTQDRRIAHLRSIISRQTRHLSALVDDLLDISRITRGKISLKREPVDIASVLQRAVETAGPIVESREHELILEHPEEPVWVDGDPTRLEQVLSNLLNNAAKYTDPGGRIWITVSLDRPTREANGGSGGQSSGRGAPPPGSVVISVRDTGKGMPEEMVPYVFDLFTQVEPTIDRTQGGLGIGLALVRNLVQMHGGTVSAHSEGPGKGSEFVVRLPLMARAPEIESAPAVPGTAEPAPAGPRTETGARQVLLVEDNHDAAETLCEILQLWGHRVQVAYSGPAALELLDQSWPDVVLLDIGLPDMDGYEVARAVRERETTRTARDAPRLLLVALTGYGQEEDRRRAQDAGFDLHLTKPVDPQELLRILRAGASPVSMAA